MTLSEFILKYRGQKVDFDKAYGAQCVDLYRQYCQDVLEIPHTGVVQGAKDLWLNYNNMPFMQKYLVKVDGSFRAGDVLVWDGGLYGHVAILLAMLGSNYIVFEQDGYKQDGAKIGLLKPSGLLGALRKRYR